MVDEDGRGGGVVDTLRGLLDSEDKGQILPRIYIDNSLRLIWK